MVHPLFIDHTEKDHALHLTDLLRIRELRFLLLIQLDGFFLQKLLELALCHRLKFLLRDVHLRDRDDA